MTSEDYKVGSLGEFMAWTKAVVRDPSLAEGTPDRWFDSEDGARKTLAQETAAPSVPATTVSPEAMVKLLSKENLSLIGVIATAKPQSMRQLADMVGRKESNLCRTLKKFERAGLVKFVPGQGRTRAPVLVATKVTLAIDLTGADRSAVAVEHAGNGLAAA